MNYNPASLPSAVQLSAEQRQKFEGFAKKREQIQNVLRASVAAAMEVAREMDSSLSNEENVVWDQVFAEHKIEDPSAYGVCPQTGVLALRDELEKHGQESMAAQAAGNEAAKAAKDAQ